MYHLKQIPSDTQIRKFLRRILFGKNIFCPICKTRKVTINQDRYWCGRCRRRFSLLSHTWLSSMRISLAKFWLILWCFVNQVPVKQTEKLTSTSEKGVRHWFDLFRSHLPNSQEVLEHIVQLDEAYFGHFTSFTRELSGFTLIMGKEKGTRKLAYELIPTDPTKLDAINFVKNHVRADSHLNTDASTIYQDIEKYYPVTHTSDIHIKFEFKNTSEIEGMFGVFRTFIRRMYHHVTMEKFPDYMSEFYLRFSHPEIFDSPYQYLLITLKLAPSG